MWSGEPRNKGLQEAYGDFVCYLDIDDLFGADHLKSLSDALGERDWIWFDDFRYLPKVKKWYQNPCDITRKGRCGTSNICHRRKLDVKWDHDGYAHDFYFILQLRSYPNFCKVEGEYFVCHLPGVGGFDL
jgi:glycosyltransferase involved in cell wall biosynthesis